MFPLWLDTRTGRLAGSRPGSRVARAGRGSPRLALLRVASAYAALALVLPCAASAQALGTMQVRARVLPAQVGWHALAEVSGLARRAVLAPEAGAVTRRAGLVQARAEVALVNGRRRLLVTVHHPHN